MDKFTVRLVLITSLLMLSACNTSTKIESDMSIRNAPDWVNEGTQAIDNDSGRLLHGVGMAAPLNDMSLQKSAADNRARAEIAKILSTYIDSTISDYSASIGEDADINIEREIRGTTRLAMSGARILGHWKDKNTGNIYAFAELDLKSMDKLVTTAANLSESFKKYYSENADTGFDRFIKSRE